MRKPGKLSPRKALEEIKRHLRALSQMRIWGSLNQVLLKLIAVVKPNAHTMEDTEADLKAIIKTFLDKAVQVFGDKRCRGAVLWPVEDGKYLAYWGEANMPAHGDWRFEIGNPQQEGTAGYSFRTQTIVRGVMSRSGDHWRCTDPHYRFREDSRHIPRYRSFVCIPLIGPESNALGVVCFDSPRVDTFASLEVQQLIVEMADSLAAALAAYQNTLESMKEIEQLKARVAMLESQKAADNRSNLEPKNQLTK